MSETPPESMAVTLKSDQVDATVADVSKAVARHYRALVDAGMSEKHAVKLARDMQEQWLQGVVPVSDLVREMMTGDEGL